MQATPGDALVRENRVRRMILGPAARYGSLLSILNNGPSLVPTIVATQVLTRGQRMATGRSVAAKLLLSAADRRPILLRNRLPSLVD